MSLTEETAAPAAKTAPALKLNFLSHGTLDSRDLDFSRKFYEEFMGFDVVKTSEISLLIRLGGNHCIAVVFSKKGLGEMNLLNHNGVDVRTKEEVDEAHKVVVANAEKWKLTKISQALPPARHLQLLFLGCRRQLLGDPDQSRGRLWLALRARRPEGQGPPRPQLQAPRREHVGLHRRPASFDWAAPLRGRSAQDEGRWSMIFSRRSILRSRSA